MESNLLFHEMWHAYQAYQETPSSYVNSLLNLDIEAHYAQYIYIYSRCLNIVKVSGKRDIERINV